MHMRIVVAGCLLALTGCTEAGPTSVDGQIGIYQDAGSTQCQDDGLSLAQMQKQLEAAEIPFTDAACGTDGRMYTAMCGSPDGKIGLFQIARQAARAGCPGRALQVEVASLAAGSATGSAMDGESWPLEAC